MITSPTPAAPPDRRYGSWQSLQATRAIPLHPNPIAAKPATMNTSPTTAVSEKRSVIATHDAANPAKIPQRIV